MTADNVAKIGKGALVALMAVADKLPFAGAAAAGLRLMLQAYERVKLHKESFMTFTERVSELCEALARLLNLFVERRAGGGVVLEPPPQLARFQRYLDSSVALVQKCTSRRWLSSLLFAQGDLNQLGDLQDNLESVIKDLQLSLTVTVIELQINGAAQYAGMREHNLRTRQQLLTDMGADGPQGLLARDAETAQKFGLSPEDVRHEMYHMMQVEYVRKHHTESGIAQLINSEPWRAFWVDKCGPTMEMVRAESLVNLVILFLKRDLKLVPEDLKKFDCREGRDAIRGLLNRSGEPQVSVSGFDTATCDLDDEMLGSLVDALNLNTAPFSAPEAPKGFVGYGKELGDVATLLLSGATSTPPGVHLRVVAGRPGSGLSAFAVALAHHMKESTTPLPVPGAGAGAGTSSSSPSSASAANPFPGGILCLQLPGIGEGVVPGAGAVDMRCLGALLSTALGLVVMTTPEDAVARYLARVPGPLLVIVDAGRHVSPAGVQETLVSFVPATAKVVLVVVSSYTVTGAGGAGAAGAGVAGAGVEAGPSGSTLARLEGLPPAAAEELVASLRPSLPKDLCAPLATVCGNLPAVIAQLCTWPLPQLEEVAKSATSDGTSAFRLSGDVHVAVVVQGLADMPLDAVRLLNALCLHGGSFSSAAVRALHVALFPGLGPGESDHLVGLMQVLTTFQYVCSSSLSSLADAIKRDGDGARFLVPSAVRIAVAMSKPGAPGDDATNRAAFVTYYGNLLNSATGFYYSKHMITGLAIFDAEASNLRAMMAVATAGAAQPLPVRWALARFLAGGGRAYGLVTARTTLPERKAFFVGLEAAVQGLIPPPGDAAAENLVAQAQGMAEFFAGLELGEETSYGQAVTWMRKALRLQLGCLGAGHPTVARTRVELANLLTEVALDEKDRGINSDIVGSPHLHEAHSMLEDAVKCFGSAGGAEFQGDVARARRELAKVYKHQGRLEEATHAYEQALGVLDRCVGRAHPEYADTLAELGNVMVDLKDYGAAEEHYIRAMDIADAAYGRNNVTSRAVLGNLGAMNYDMEPEPNLAKAVEYYTEALEMTKEVLGPSHEDVGVLQNTVAGIYSKLGNFSQAIKFYREDANGIKARHGIHSEAYADALAFLAEAYERSGDAATAKAYDDEISAVKAGAAAASAAAAALQR